MLNNPQFEDFDYNLPVKDGDFNSHLVKYYVDQAEVDYDISHGLGRIPTRVSIVKNDSPIIFEVTTMDKDRAIIKFFENQTTIILRFE